MKQFILASAISSSAFTILSTQHNVRISVKMLQTNTILAGYLCFTFAGHEAWNRSILYDKDHELIGDFEMTAGSNPICQSFLSARFCISIRITFCSVMKWRMESIMWWNQCCWNLRNCWIIAYKTFPSLFWQIEERCQRGNEQKSAVSQNENAETFDEYCSWFRQL